MRCNITTVLSQTSLNTQRTNLQPSNKVLLAFWASLICYSRNNHFLKIVFIPVSHHVNFKDFKDTLSFLLNGENFRLEKVNYGLNTLISAENCSFSSCLLWFSTNSPACSRMISLPPGCWRRPKINYQAQRKIIKFISKDVCRSDLPKSLLLVWNDTVWLPNWSVVARRIFVSPYGKYYHGHRGQ